MLLLCCCGGGLSREVGLQCVAVCCREGTLQHTATHCSTLQKVDPRLVDKTLQESTDWLSSNFFQKIGLFVWYKKNLHQKKSPDFWKKFELSQAVDSCSVLSTRLGSIFCLVPTRLVTHVRGWVQTHSGSPRVLRGRHPVCLRVCSCVHAGIRSEKCPK